jgi:hypothetical protein
MKRNMLRHSVAAALAALFGLACGHTETRSVAFGRAASDDVVALPAAPSSPGHHLGVVSAQGGESAQSNDVRVLYAELVRQTRALGGNAIVLDAIDTKLEDRCAIFSGLPSPHGCGAGSLDGIAHPASDDAVTVELRGKALRLSPDERAALRAAPVAADGYPTPRSER